MTLGSIAEFPYFLLLQKRSKKRITTDCFFFSMFTSVYSCSNKSTT